MSAEADHRTARARLERIERFHFVASFPDVPDAPPLAIDEQPPLGDGSGPNPASLLAAALGSCLAASLVFCLKRAKIHPAGVAADVTAHIVRNEKGRFRIGDVDVELSLDCADADPAGVDRCRELYEDFCIVTESVRHGIPVNVRIAQRQPAST